MADEFLRDFGAVDEEEELEEVQGGSEAEEDEDKMEGVVEDSIIAGAFKRKQANLLELDEEKLQKLLTCKSVYDLVKIPNSPELASLLSKIEELKSKHSNSMEVVSQVDEEAEYDLLTSGNEMVARIQNETQLTHRYLRDIYTHRWPELEQLVPNPLDYARCVKKLGNNVLLARVELSTLLPSASIISLSVAATNTSGKPLNDEELQRAYDSCDVLLQLDDTRLKIISYIESRMKFFAPNISALIGPEIAAKLISLAGGLTNLGRMVSGNLQALGISKKGSLHGMSTATGLSHVGYIMESDLIQRCPANLFKKAYRLVSGKCMIAARVDSFHQSPHGQIGAALRDEIEAKIEKWQEPPPAKKEKALPLPEQKKKKHRGGRRARQQASNYAMTELRKRANRLKFGEVSEEYGSNTGREMGMLNQEGHGLLRIAANYGDKGFKIKPIKDSKGKITTPAVALTTGAAVTTHGLRTIVGASAAGDSVNPMKARMEALKAKNGGYFSSVGGFTSVIKKD